MQVPENFFGILNFRTEYGVEVEEFWTGVRPCPRRRRHQDSRASTPGDGTPWAATSTLQYTGHEARRIGFGANTGVLVCEIFWIRLL